MVIAGDKFVINGLAGEKRLSGEVLIGGAKNEVLKVLSASLLFRDSFKLENVPDIADVHQLIKLLSELGIVIEREDKHSYKLNTSSVTSYALVSDISKKLRSSIVLTGPLLARMKRIIFPYPGGCVIGKRPIDLFLNGFKKMGATIEEKDGLFDIIAPDDGLRGAEIFFKNQSVTATETFLMAGVLAKGKTVLKNCALEPEIESLGSWLCRCGAKIEGLGTPTITIYGGDLLSGEGKTHQTMPDRIEAGSFIVLGALTAKDLLVKNCNPQHLDSLLNLLRESGVNLEIGVDWVRVLGDNNDKLVAFDLKTHEYPGFPTDLQAPLCILLTQAEGQSYIFETIFEGRLNYLDALDRMGAKVKILDVHRAIIDGPTKLSGKEIVSPDLRAGLAYVLAGAIASGQTVVHNVEYIDRGYEAIETRLRQLGLDIERVKE